MIEIRAARPEDAAAIARIHTDSWDIAYRGLLSADADLSRSYDGRLQYWKQRLVHSPQGIFLADDDALGPMGFVACGTAADPVRTEQALFRGEIQSLYVRPICQGMGVGRRLFNAAIANLVAAGFSRVLIWIHEDGPGIGFLEHLDGQPIAERLAGDGQGEGARQYRETAYGWGG